MGKVLKYSVLLVAIVLFFFPQRTFSQKSDFQHVENTTLQFFIQQKWDSVVQTGLKAIDSGYDYYYLRLRMGISYFYMQDYRKATIHLKAAERFNSFDTLTRYYLFYSFLAGGQNSQAQYMAQKEKRIKGLQQNYLSRKGISEFYLETGLHFFTEYSKYKQSDINGAGDVFGETDLANQSQYIHFGLRHRPFKRVSIYHGINVFSIQGSKVFHLSDNKILDPYTIRQTDYYINMNILMPGDMIITPALHIVGDKKHSLELQGFESWGPVLAYHDTTIKNMAVSFSVRRNFGKVELAAGAVRSNITSTEKWQYSAVLGFFPRGNLNQYYETKWYFIPSTSGKNRMVFSQIAGFKTTSRLWSEVGLTIGNLNNLAEDNAFILYNITDSTRFRCTFNVIYLLSPSFDLRLRYEFFRRSSEYGFYTDPGLSFFQIQPTQYSSHFMTGGILWKLNRISTKKSLQR